MVFWCFRSITQVRNPPGNRCDYKGVIPNRSANFLAQCDFYDCDTAISLREKLATSRLWVPIASDLWLRLRGSLRFQCALWPQIITNEKLFWSNYFLKNTKFTCNSLKMSVFPGHVERRTCLRITKNNSQGIIFVIISCQRVENKYQKNTNGHPRKMSANFLLFFPLFSLSPPKNGSLPGHRGCPCLRFCNLLVMCPKHLLPLFSANKVVTLFLSQKNKLTVQKLDV